MLTVNRSGNLDCRLFRTHCLSDHDVVAEAYCQTDCQCHHCLCYKFALLAQAFLVLPEYLALWFKREEFDREASYYGVGGVRGSLEWEDFCDMAAPIPSVEEQKKIVAEYQIIENRIKLKRQINDNLAA